MRRSEQHEIEDLIKTINLQALAERASSLRKGMPCVVPTLNYDLATRSTVMGGMNFHIDLTFSDGVDWIARIRRANATSPPPRIRDAIFAGEVATLKLLERTSVPAPKIHDFALEGPENAVGVGYMLQEKKVGRSCEWALAEPEQKANFFVGSRGRLHRIERLLF